MALTLTAIRMRSNHVLVKNLETVETLGSCSCICSDKTGQLGKIGNCTKTYFPGTLTENKMSSSHCWVSGKTFNITKNEFSKEEFDRDVTFQLLHRCAILCNDAQFDDNEKNMKIEPLSREVI